MQIDIDNQSDFVLNTEFLTLLEALFLAVLEELNLESKNCELLLVDNATICNLNTQFRGISNATDVLSFPLESEFSSLLGSVVISVEYAQEVSLQLKHSLENEIALLFLHGILHLVGFNHENDGGEQRTMESKILAKFNLPTSLIVRTEG